MATDKEHLRQAQHNQELLDTIDRERFPDWAATVAFYKAVHLVQALFHTTHDSCGSHSKRNGILREKFPEIWKQYQPLYTFSRLGRYWCMRVKTEHVQYILRRLGRVEAEVAKENGTIVASPPAT
jgi:hypothetical protein